MIVLCAFALAIAGLASDARTEDPISDRRPPWPLLIVAAVALAATLVGYEATIARAALGQLPYPAWLRGAPLVPVLDAAPHYAHTSSAIVLAAETLAVVQTALLALVAYALRGVSNSRLLSWFFAAFAALSIALAFGARAIASGDLYAYAFDAAHGTDAYRSLPIATDGPFALVGHLWSFRMLPAAYGPVWLVIARAIAGGGTDLAHLLVRERLFSAMSLAALIGALVASRVPAVFLGLVALDPVFAWQFVADGHNDAFGIALLLWARVAVRRGSLPVALVLASLAGASKAPFLVLAPLAFVDIPGGRRRLTAAAIACFGGVALSLALGGLAYPRALASVAAAFPVAGEPGGALLPRLTMLATLGLVAAAVIARRTGWPGTWAFVSLGSIVFPWYLLWGLPYATLDTRRALPFLVTFPLAAYALTTTFPITMAWEVAVSGATCLALFSAYRRVRAAFVAAGRRSSTLGVPS